MFVKSFLGKLRLFRWLIAFWTLKIWIFKAFKQILRQRDELSREGTIKSVSFSPLNVFFSSKNVFFNQKEEIRIFSRTKVFHKILFFQFSINHAINIPKKAIWKRKLNEIFFHRRPFNISQDMKHISTWITKFGRENFAPEKKLANNS